MEAEHVDVDHLQPPGHQAPQGRRPPDLGRGQGRPGWDSGWASISLSVKWECWHLLAGVAGHFREMRTLKALYRLRCFTVWWILLPFRPRFFRGKTPDLFICIALMFAVVKDRCNLAAPHLVYLSVMHPGNEWHCSSYQLGNSHIVFMCPKDSVSCRARDAEVDSSP